MQIVEEADINVRGIILENVPGIGDMPLLYLSCPPGPAASLFIPFAIAHGLPRLRTDRSGLLLMDRADGAAWVVRIGPGKQVDVDWPAPGLLVYGCTIATPAQWCALALEAGDCCLVAGPNGIAWNPGPRNLGELVQTVQFDAALGFVTVSPT